MKEAMGYFRGKKGKTKKFSLKLEAIESFCKFNKEGFWGNHGTTVQPKFFFIQVLI